MKLALIVLSSMTLLTGMVAPACYANGTVIYDNSHSTNKAWNDAWGLAWSSTSNTNTVSEVKALQRCRDTMMNKDALFEQPGQYKVHVSDANRDWDIMVNSKGDGKGAASCSVH